MKTNLDNNYKDKKKYLWMLSTLIPLIGIAGIKLIEFTQNQWLILMPLVFIYVLVPLLDMIFNEDQSNPPESAVAKLEESSYYRILTYCAVPLHYFVLIYTIHYLSTHQLHWSVVAIITFTTAIIGGLAINLGHELGHKKNRLDKALAEIVLAIPFYGHFNVEHNAGHHVQVATPEDSASAKFGQNIYQFALREIPHGIYRGWSLEKKRLQRKNKSIFSWHNQILRSYFLSVILYSGLIYFYGSTALLFLALHAPLSWWQLTSANYIEHYGLLRLKNADGNYERCQPKHSWNSNHLVSNLMLFHLQRHSDHHANSSRHYQSLRHFPEAPQLPTGYMGMFLVSYIPPLWFKIMNKRVLKAVNNDMNLVNT